MSQNDPWFNASWQSWLSEAIKHGMPPEKLVETLINEGFTFSQVKRILGNHFPASLAKFSDEPLYKQHAYPNLLNNEKAKRKHETVAIYEVEDALPNVLCEKIASLAKRKLYPSKIPVKQEGELERYRTSFSSDLSSINQQLFEETDQLLWRLLGPQIGGAQSVQAQLYKEGGEFKVHHDCYYPGTDAYRKLAKEGGQRTWTVMAYVIAPEKGGETVFPELGLSFTPKVGSAVIWNNLHIDGSINQALLHQAKPVLKGEKMVLTKWFCVSEVRSNSCLNKKKKGPAVSTKRFL